MDTGKIVVVARCIECYGKGINNFRISDSNGGFFWSSDEEYRRIAESQRGSDALDSDDPLSHIAWVAHCGHNFLKSMTLAAC